jgi:serine/threonine protein kinase/tetratricopeptide (TPR) repeat protein
VNLQTERALFDACVALPAEERDAWLALHCADPSSRERVSRLLRAHDEAEARGTLQSPLARELPEQRVGPYRLIERIGEGAMGEVFLAEQTAPVARRVALKVIKPGMDSREVIARFELERQTLALMSHPSIAHIIDAGTTETGRPYFAMEYVPGIPLTKYCDRHRLSIDARLVLFMRICDAVQHAHQKGVIHRDLKPGNLLVADLDGHPTPKVIDFGIAKAVAPGQQASQAHTRIGHLIGTPEYMSPEQAQLSPLDVDTRADVYSLGVVLHELLTGALPFKTTDPNATPAMLVQELLTHNPAAPSERVRVGEPVSAESAAQRQLTQRQLAARLAGDLDWIVLKALEKDRNRRYGSPAELAADIRRHIANEPVLAGPPFAIYRMRKFAGRHRLALSIVGGLFAAALVFGGLMARQAHEIALQRDEARFQAQRAEASSEFMSLMLEEVGPGGAPLSPVELVDRGVELLNRQYGGDPRFSARMLLQMSRRYMDLGNTEKQSAVLTRAETLARELKDDELLAAIDCAIVSSEVEANRIDESKRKLVDARAVLARLPDAPLGTRVDCLRAESEIAELGRAPETAIARLSEAQKLLEESGQTKGLQYNAVLTDLGGIYFRTNRFREALALNLQTSEALDRNGRGGTLAKVTVTQNRASLLYRLGEVKRAQAVGLEALRRAQALRSGQRVAPQMAVAFSVTLNRLDQTGQAADLLASAREDAKALGNEFWGAAASYHLGRAFLLAGKLDRAQAPLDDAGRIWKANETANSDRLADLTRTLAELELARGKTAAAVELIETSLTRFNYPQDTRGNGIAAALIAASRIYLKHGDADKAIAFGEAGLALAEGIARDPRESADVGEACLVLANAHHAKGNRAGARQLLARSVESLTHGLGADHHLTREAQGLLRTTAT